MRLGWAALVVVAVFGAAACGGDDSEPEPAAPLTLEQRLPTAAEAPGTKPDPVEKRVTATGVQDFLAKVTDRLINPTEKDRRAFEQTGFVRAVLDARFYGTVHTSDAPHVFTLLAQFESGDGARQAVELLHEDGRRPCPEDCGQQVSEFDVDGTSDAKGVRRVLTAERAKTFGGEGEAFDSYTIRFADGPFAYDIELSGPPGRVSEEQAEDIAEKLYDRVRGAPATNG